MAATRDGGIRCVYHGWKFDADGNCVDMPNLPPEQDLRHSIPGAKPEIDYLPATTDWYGRWRSAANAENDYLIDRDAQRNDVIYTGITQIHMQDQAITESMGPIVDHSFEHLAPSDQMITRTRRRLLLAARALRDHGTVPPGVDAPDLYAHARSGECVMQGADWQADYEERLKHVVRPLEMRHAAEGNRAPCRMPQTGAKNRKTARAETELDRR